MSSSIAAISSIVAIIRALVLAGSTLSARMRREASGVRRSWPIAPSMRSFSSSIAPTRALIALKARIARARSAGPRGSTLRRLAAAVEALGGGGEIAQRAGQPRRDPDHRGEDDAYR